MEKHELVSAGLTRLVKETDVFVELPAPVMTPVMMKDQTAGDRKDNGGWKNVTLIAGSEYQLTSVRAGAREPLFVFTPVDSRDFEYAEIGLKKVTAAFPSLEKQIHGLLNSELHKGNLQLTVREYAKYLASHAEAEQEEADKTRYEDNELWGAF